MTWETPPDGTERAERLKAWQATVADAIARTRRREGFDGTQRTWQTLGECLPLSEAEDRALTTVVLLTEPRAKRAAYRNVRSQRAAHFQELARQDIGRLVG